MACMMNTCATHDVGFVRGIIDLMKLAALPAVFFATSNVDLKEKENKSIINRLKSRCECCCCFPSIPVCRIQDASPLWVPFNDGVVSANIFEDKRVE